MISIMLMRAIEAPLFDQTREWLKKDADAVFHLFVDELHLYRGTAGPEVAYLIRPLLDRLGLYPGHKKLRIVASSASLGSGKAATEFLAGFFGCEWSDHQIVRDPVREWPRPATGRCRWCRTRPRGVGVAGHRSCTPRPGPPAGRAGLSAAAGRRSSCYRRRWSQRHTAPSRTAAGRLARVPGSPQGSALGGGARRTPQSAPGPGRGDLPPPSRPPRRMTRQGHRERSGSPLPVGG